MTIIQIRCPKCRSTNVHPTFCTPYEMDCMACRKEFDLRGGFWARLWAILTRKRYGGFWS